jgi:hypothetical protein
VARFDNEAVGNNTPVNGTSRDTLSGVAARRDVALPDVAAPDIAIPDVAIPDVAIPDAEDGLFWDGHWTLDDEWQDEWQSETLAAGTGAAVPPPPVVPRDKAKHVL